MAGAEQFGLASLRARRQKKESEREYSRRCADLRKSKANCLLEKFCFLMSECGRDPVPTTTAGKGTWFQNPAIEETIFLAFFDKKRDGAKLAKQVEKGISDTVFVLAGTAVSDSN